MIDWNMTYNSAKDNLTIPEYGRHVQLLVDHARTIEDDELRQRFAERIIRLMMQMVPQNKNIEGYKGKLWRHLFRIAENDLRVSLPEGVEMPEDTSGRLFPDQVPYPESEAKEGHRNGGRAKEGGLYGGHCCLHETGLQNLEPRTLRKR